MKDYILSNKVVISCGIFSFVWTCQAVPWHLEWHLRLVLKHLLWFAWHFLSLLQLRLTTLVYQKLIERWLLYIVMILLVDIILGQKPLQAHICVRIFVHKNCNNPLVGIFFSGAQKLCMWSDHTCELQFSVQINWLACYTLLHITVSILWYVYIMVWMMFMCSLKQVLHLEVLRHQITR